MANLVKLEKFINPTNIKDSDVKFVEEYDDKQSLLTDMDNIKEIFDEKNEESSNFGLNFEEIERRRNENDSSSIIYEEPQDDTSDDIYIQTPAKEAEIEISESLSNESIMEQDDILNPNREGYSRINIKPEPKLETKNKEFEEHEQMEEFGESEEFEESDEIFNKKTKKTKITDQEESLEISIENENSEGNMESTKISKNHYDILQEIMSIRDEIQQIGSLPKNFEEKYEKSKQNINYAAEYREILDREYRDNLTSSGIRDFIIMYSQIVSKVFNGERNVPVLNKKIPDLTGYDIQVKQKISYIKRETNKCAKKVNGVVGENFISIIQLIRTLGTPLITVYLKNLGKKNSSYDVNDYFNEFSDSEDEYENPLQ